jgi:hypothetical protein
LETLAHECGELPEKELFEIVVTLALEGILSGECKKKMVEFRGGL